MRVRTLLFASHRDLAKAESVDVELDRGATVSDLVAALRAQGGAWADLPETTAVAVNHRYAPHDLPIGEDDEVALIPPVAGG